MFCRGVQFVFDSDKIWQVLALVLIAEGLLPFLSPRQWRSMFEQLLKMNDGQIRFIGLCAVLSGIVLFLVV